MVWTGQSAAGLITVFAKDILLSLSIFCLSFQCIPDSYWAYLQPLSQVFFFLILIAFKPPDLIHWVFLAKYAGNFFPVKFYLVYYSPLFQDVKGIIGYLEFWLWQNHSYYSFLVCMIFTLKAWLLIFLSSVKYNE